MSYLQCPECRLTVPASAYYLRGDECPRCLTAMEKRPSFARDAATMDEKWSRFARRSPASPSGGSPPQAA